MHHHHDCRASRQPDATLKLARTLGWLSLGLAAAGFLAPRQVERAIGMDERSRLFAALGAVATVGLVELFFAGRPTAKPLPDFERLADYRQRSGFPRPPEVMRGLASNGHAGPPVHAMSAASLP